MRMVLSDVRKKVSPHVLAMAPPHVLATVLPMVLAMVLAMVPPHVQGILNEAFFYYL